MPGEIAAVLDKLDWMRAERIWPNGLCYLWSDAFGVVLLVSLCREASGLELFRNGPSPLPGRGKCATRGHKPCNPFQNQFFCHPERSEGSQVF